jgi:hypothetical protein
MLTFLAIACRQKFVLDSYEDEAVGHMEKNAEGRMAITRIELRQDRGARGESIAWCGGSEVRTFFRRVRDADF